MANIIITSVKQIGLLLAATIFVCSCGQVNNNKTNSLGMVWKYEDFEQPLSVGVAISGDKTMVCSMYGTEYALIETLTGQNIWHKTLEDVEPANENIFQPVDVGRKMIFTAGNQLRCFDMEDGTQLWNFGAQETQIGPPTFYEPAVANGRIYIGSNTGSLYCLDAPSGIQNWQITSKEDAYGPTIALNNKIATLMLSSRIECRRQDQGWLVWKNDHFRMPLETIPNDGKILYLSNPGPSIAALNPDDMKVVWETSLDKKSGMLAIPPTVDGSFVYCCDENKIYCFSKADGKLSSSFEIPFDPETLKTNSGLIYITSKNILYCYDKSGKQLAQFKEPNGDKLCGIDFGAGVIVCWTARTIYGLAR